MLLVAPTMLDPFSVHWYSGVAPPTTVAVKTMLVPVQTVVVPLGVTVTLEGGATQAPVEFVTSCVVVAQPELVTLQL